MGFPNNSLSKYMKIMYDLGIPYVVYGYILDKETKTKIEIEYNGKRYGKLCDVPGDEDVSMRIINTYKKYVEGDCSNCKYKKAKIIKEIASYENRIVKLKMELQREIYKKNRGIQSKNSITIFDMAKADDKGRNDNG